MSALKTVFKQTKKVSIGSCVINTLGRDKLSFTMNNYHIWIP